MTRTPPIRRRAGSCASRRWYLRARACSILRAGTAGMHASSPRAMHAFSRSTATQRCSRRLRGIANVTTRAIDLEGEAWPLAGERFDAIVVTNYLHRPWFAALLDALADDGVLLYETFAAGNEAYGRPSNPAFLLEPRRAGGAGAWPAGGRGVRAGPRRRRRAHRRRPAAGRGRARPPLAALADLKPAAPAAEHRRAANRVKFAICLAPSC